MIGLGIIGAGIMGERLVRAAVEQAADSVRITGIWDPAAAAMARMGREFPGIAAAASPETLIAASDCVYVASPPGSHLEHAGRIVAAGRALFCEKPLAVDVAQATDFVARADGARAAVNFPFASSFAVQRLRQWIAEGVVGAPQSLEIEVAFAEWPRSWQRDAAGWLDATAQGGFTREVVSHFLFLTHRLLGPLDLQARTATFDVPGRSERSISATLMAGGVKVTLTGGVGITEKDDHNLWTLQGANGKIRLRDWSFAERLQDGAWQADPDALPNAQMRPLVLQRQLAGVAAMTGGEPHHLARLDEALAVQRVVETILGT